MPLPRHSDLAPPSRIIWVNPPTMHMLLLREAWTWGGKDKRSGGATGSHPSSDQEPRWEVGRQGSALSCLRPTQRPESQVAVGPTRLFTVHPTFICQHHAKHLLHLHEDYLKKKKLNFLLWENFQAYIKVQSSFHEPIISSTIIRPANLCAPYPGPLCSYSH